MKLYLENLIPRLKEFSLSLDKQEVFVDKQWVIIDEESNKQTYIFRRSGDLIMSLNGQVTIGKWEYLSAAKSLLIDRIHDKILLNQAFIDPAVMILKKDGFNGDSFIMANEHLIPNLDVPKYLKQLFLIKNDVNTIELINGDLLEISKPKNSPETYIKDVSMSGNSVENGKYTLKDKNLKYLIKNNKLVRIIIRKRYKTKRGELIIEETLYDFPRRGDLVFLNEEIAPNGKYRIGFLDVIIVENGMITKISLF